MLNKEEVLTKEEIFLKIDSKEVLDRFKAFLRVIEAKESALVKWEFIDWALNSEKWDTSGSTRAFHKLDKPFLVFEAGINNCKLCSVYFEENIDDDNCYNCPLMPFAGKLCENVWWDWTIDRKPMLKAIDSMLEKEGLSSSEVLSRNLTLLEKIL